MADQSTERTEAETATTKVDVKCTGNVRGAIGTPRLTFTFEGSTLREFFLAFFEEYDVRNLLLAETDEEATTQGWAPPLEGVPGKNWKANPEGDRTSRYARVLVNGRFNQHLGGLNTELKDGDRVALAHPFIFCC